MIRRCFEKAGFDVLCFSNPVAALLEMADKADFIDAVFMDICFPNDHGSTLLLRIKSLSDAPIIAISGIKQSLEVMQAMPENLRPDAFLDKDNLLDCVNVYRSLANGR